MSELDSDVLAGDAEIIVSLAGKSYTWPEMNCRESRAIVRALIPIQRMGEDQSPENLLLVADMALDFFYKFNPSMNSDRKFLDAHAEETEIGKVFAEVAEHCTGPFVRRNTLKVVENSE